MFVLLSCRFLVDKLSLHDPMALHSTSFVAAFNLEVPYQVQEHPSSKSVVFLVFY